MRNRLAILAVFAFFVLWAVGISTAQQQQNQNLQITNGPTVESMTGNSAVVAWSTNVEGSTILKYGTDPNNLNQTAQVPWGGTAHRVTISNLQPNTTYYFDVESMQGQGTGTGAISNVAQFKTTNGEKVDTPAAAAGSNASEQPSSSAQQGQNPNQSVQITNGPSVENVTNNSAVIAWSTNVNAGTVLMYGTDPNNLNQTAQAPWGGLTHRVTISNLQPNTTYYFDVESAQGQGTGTGAISNISQFKTKQ